MSAVSNRCSAEDLADERLQAWASWFGRGIADGPAQPSCTLGRLLDQRVAAGQRGAPLQVPPEVEEVEKVVLRLHVRERTILRTYYCDYSTMDQKAKDCGLSRNGYWRAIRRIRITVHSELY